MASRLAACEPCRKSKLACDHSRPVCTRCRNSNRTGLCVYRTAPFKRRRTGTTPAQDPSRSIRTIGDTESIIPAFAPTRTPNRYPNPGYTGSSSHVAIFNHIPAKENNPNSVLNGEATLPCTQPQDDLLTQRGADRLKQLFSTFSLRYMEDLVQSWLARGANLTLTGGIVQHCLKGIDLPISTSTSTNEWHLLNAKYLSANSSQPLETSRTMSFPEFCVQFTDQNIRWEALGIFLSAVTRAAMDTSFFQSLYTSEEQRYTLQRLCTRVADSALEIALSLDCLNDLQLFLQYENWIVHTNIYGDHSYHSWRRLGDLIASIYALGYHEKLDNYPNCPQFLTELRKAVFARVYSGDKNVAIFLGRPPRMDKRFCHFQVPSSTTAEDIWLLSSASPGDVEDIAEWRPDTRASFMAESRWTAMCAYLKEDILCLQREKKCDATDFQRRIAEIRATAEKQFDLLPTHLKLECSLRKCTNDSFKRDFLAAVRLNHLHVMFMLSLLQLHTPAEPDTPTVEIAEEIISLIVDLILLRDQIVNSGTSLVWKITYYALPAAGILLLALLNQRTSPTAPRLVGPRVLQHLTILAAELQAGSIIQPCQPNFELISKAMQTIQSFLDSVAADAMQVAPGLLSGMMDEWPRFANQQTFDFEIGFWQSLADHPLLNQFMEGVGFE
ncbi:hypothetical protein BDW67DRAFT_193577 [Aspergillus spinulosporus]